ncbi:MAG: hypothetical protein ACTSWW_06540 [Promethearchaeota archaeon]
MKHEKKSISCEILLRDITRQFSKFNKEFQFNASNCTILNSKKHYVVKTTLLSPTSPPQASNREVVIKYFNREIKQSEFLWENEKKMHQQISSICQKKTVPKLIDFCPGIIMYEYIPGITYKQLLLDHELTDSLLQVMAQSIFRLHQAGLIFKDPRLGHFLISPKQEFFIFDYEEVEMGNPRENVAQFLTSFIDLYPGILENPKCDYFIARMLVFLKYYLSESHDLKNEIDPNTNLQDFVDVWTTAILQNLRFIAQRRETSKSPDQWEQILSSLKQAFLHHFS